MIEVNIPIFNIASIELGLTCNKIKDSHIFRTKGYELKERMDRIADTLEIMLKNDWNIVCEIFYLIAYKDDIKSVRQARTELKRLGINVDYLFFTKYNESEENGEEMG